MVSPIGVLLVGEQEAMVRIGKWIRGVMPSAHPTRAGTSAALDSALRKKGIGLAVVQHPPAWDGGEQALGRIRERWPGCAVLWLIGPGAAPDAGAALEADLDGVLVDTPGLRSELALRLQLASAHATVRESEARYRSLFDHVPVGLYRTSERGEIVDANAELVRMLSYPDRETLLRSGPSKMFGRPSDWQQVLDRGRGQPILRAAEIEMRRADGEPLWVEGVARPLTDPSGKTIAFEGSLLDVTARRRLEQEIRASGERFRALVQNASDVICVINERAEFEYVTPSAKTELGYEPEELLGRSGFDLIHPDDLAVVAEAFGAVLQHANAGTPTEYRFRHANGQWVAVESIANNMLDQPGVGGIVLTSRVITERKRAEAELSESRRRLSTLLGNLPGMAYRCRNDRERTMGFVSEGCLGLTGYRTTDLQDNRALSYASLIHPEDREGVWQEVQACTRQGRRFEITYRILTASGEMRWVWEQGGVVGVAADGTEILEGFLSDVSDRKAVEEDLHASRAWLQHIVESIDDVLIVYDRDGRYLDVICGDDSLLMRPATEMLGRTVTEILPPEAAQRFLAGIRIVLDQGLPYDFEYPLDVPGGRRWFRARGRRIRASDTGTLLSLWSISDLTERKATEEALVKQSRRLELLSRTSQQLNAVLEVPAVLRALVASGMDLVDGAGGTAGLWTGEAMRFTEYNRDGLIQSIDSALAPGEGIPGMAAETCRSCLINDPAKKPRLASAVEDLSIRNLINVPILSREGALLGCLEVHNRRWGEAFDEADVSMLEGLASSAAVALENAHLLHERLQAEADLRRLKEFNEDIIQSMGEGIVVQDRLGRFTFINPAAADMLGYAADELLGEPWTKVVPPDQHTIVKEVDAKREAGGASRYELEFVRKGGERLPALVSGNPRFEDGCFTGMLAVFADISERTRAEESLRASEARFRAFFTHAAIGIALVDQDGEVLEANAALHSMLGYSGEELKGQLQWDLMHAEDAAVGRRLHEEVCAGRRQPYQIETRYCHRAGHVIDTRLTVSLVPRPTSDPASSIWMIEDITERMRAESALRESERRFRLLVERAADAVFLHDLEGAIVDVNQQACEGLGYSREELLKLSVQDIEAEVTEATERDLWRRATGGAPVTLEGAHRRKDGSTFPVELRIGGFDIDGRPYILALARDITERRKSDEALRETTERLQALVHAAPVGVTVVDLDGRIRLWNPSAQQMFGVAPEEVLDKPLSSLRSLQVENVDTFIGVMQQVLAGETVLGKEVRAYRKDSVPLEVMVSAAPLRDSAGRIHAVMGVLADVTDRRRAEAGLERHVREMSVLYETSLEVADSGDPMQIVRTVLTRAADLLGAPMGGVYLMDEAGRQLELVVTHNLPAGFQGRRLLLGEGLAGKVALSGEAMVVNDHTAWEGRHTGNDSVSFRRMAGAPLRHGARVLGVINVIDDQRTDPYEADEVRVLQLFADQAAIALENARLLEETRRRAIHLESVTSVAAALRAARHRDEVMPVILNRLQDLVGAQGALLAMEGRGTQGIVVPVASGAWSPLEGTRQTESESLFGEVLATGKAMMQVDTGGEAWRRLPIEIQRTPAVALIPLVEQEEVVGLLGVGRREPFGQAERSLLLALAEVVGNALHRADMLETLEERVQIRTRELAEANERLKELDRLKSDFVSNVSHELRTPITNVLLYLDLLQQPGREDRRGTYMQVLRRESERLGHLIEDLLMLSRMDQAALQLNRELRTLDPILAEVVTAHRARAQSKRIELTLEPNPEVPAVWIGYQQVIQVFNNLVGNAVAYTLAGGRVTLTSLVQERPDGSREVGARVWNDGPPISAEDLPMLFQRFYRGKTGRESGEAGTGLGLAICKEIIDRHAGRIDVQSSPEEGTSFTIWLPVGSPAGPDA